MEEDFIRKSVPESYLEAVQKYEDCLSDYSAHEESKDEELDWDITDSKQWEERDKKNRQAKQQRLKERNDEINRLTALFAQSKNKKERSYWLRKLAAVARTEIEGVTILSDPPGAIGSKKDREKRWEAEKLEAKKIRQKTRRSLYVALIIIGACLVIFKS